MNRLRHLLLPAVLLALPAAWWWHGQRSLSSSVAATATVASAAVSAPVQAAPNFTPAATVAGIKVDSPVPAASTDHAVARFDRWLQRYAAAAPADRAVLAAEGRALAASRRTVLAELIRFDPEAALLAAVPAELRGQLPREITELLEDPVSGRGALMRNAITPARGQPVVEPVFHAAVIGREQYRAYVYGRRAQQGSLTDTSLIGIALDGNLAVHESPVRVLDATIASAGSIAVEFDGQTSAVNGAGELADLRAQLIAREDNHAINAAAGGPGSSGVAGRPAPSWSQGTKKLLMIRVDFPDRPGTPVHANGQAVTPDMISTLVNGANGVRAFYVENSYGKTSVQLAAATAGASPDVTPVLRMPDVSSYYAGTGIDRSGVLLDDALAAAQAAGFNVAGYDRVGLVFSRLPFPWDGLGNIIGRYFWINGDCSFYVVAHELGHTYGAMHSNFWYAADGNPVSNAGQTQEYGDFWDVMGSGNFFQHHFSQWNKSILQWLPDTAVTSVEASGTYRIHRFDHGSANLAQPRALKIRRDDTRDYWIGYRRGTDDAAYDNGAYVLWGYNQNQPANLLDLTGSPNSPTDAPLQVGATFTDSVSGIVLRAVAQGGSGADEWLDVEVTVPGGSGPSDPANAWLPADIGAAGQAGGTTVASGTVSVKGSGADIWGTADAFHFSSQVLTGDGAIVARVTGITNTHAWAKAGLMFREDFTPGSRAVMAFVTPGNRAGFQYRVTPDGASAQAPEAYAGAPQWLMVSRAGNVFTGYRSVDGTSWVSLGAVTCSMPPQVFVGLAVTSHNNAQVATGTFGNVDVVATNTPAVPSAPTGLRASAGAAASVTLNWTDTSGNEGGFVIERATGASGTFSELASVEFNVTTFVDAGVESNTTYSYRVRAYREFEYSDYSNTVLVTTTTTASSTWQGGDIGAVGLAGSETVAGSTIAVNAGGADIWNAADGFRFVYQPWRGDGEIVTRVARLDNTHAWAKAGVMIRESLAPGSRYVAYLLTAANTSGLQVRAATGGATTLANGPWVNAPYWLKLVRSGDTFTASTSPDGVTWTQRGSQVLALGQDVYLGCAVSSHTTTARTTAVFEQVQLPATTPTPTDPPPPAPATWAQANWGTGGGSLAQDGAAVAITARGADLWNQFDDGVFFHQPLTGDGEIVAKLDSVTNTHTWAKAGVMIRESLAATSPNVFLGVTPANTATVQVRATSSGVTTEAQRGWGVGAPRWLKLSRTGNVFTAAHSSDGVTWTSLGSQTLALPANVHIGLSVASHASAATTAIFSSVAVKRN